MIKLEKGHIYTGEYFNKIQRNELYNIVSKKEELYVFDEMQLKNYLENYSPQITYMLRKVNIPNDATIYVYNNKYKTDKVIAQNAIPIGNIKPEKVCEIYKECVEFIDNNYQNKNHQHHTQKCINILNINGLMINFIKDATDEMYLEAIKQNKLVKIYVQNQVEELCLTTIQKMVNILNT